MSELPPPPPYRPAPPPYPPSFPPVPPRRSSKVLWIVLGCVAGIGILGILAVVGLVLALRTDGSHPATASARAAASYPDHTVQGAFALGRDYLAALQQRDAARASALFCDHRSIDYSSVPADQTFTTITIDSTGADTAVARLQSTIGTVPTTNVIDFAYRDGTWCVAD